MQQLDDSPKMDERESLVTEGDSEDAAASADGSRADQPTLDVPADATPEEAAAIVAAVRAHLQDAERASESADETEPVSKWRLQSRLGRRARRLRQPVRRGEEWKAAARTA